MHSGACASYYYDNLIIQLITVVIRCYLNSSDIENLKKKVSKRANVLHVASTTRK